MATAQIFSVPIGSQLTSAIGADDDADKNDFTVIISWDENTTGLTQSNLSVNNGASIQSLEGQNSTYICTIRPPTTAAVITFTIAQNAVNEGNTETTLDIRVSTAFPDSDVVEPTQLFAHGLSNEQGIALTPTRVLISTSTAQSQMTIEKFTHSGTQQSGESASISGTSIFPGDIDVINGDILVSNRAGAGGGRIPTY